MVLRELQARHMFTIVDSMERSKLSRSESNATVGASPEKSQ